MPNVASNVKSTKKQPPTRVGPCHPDSFLIGMPSYVGQLPNFHPAFVKSNPRPIIKNDSAQPGIEVKTNFFASGSRRG